MKDRLTPSGWVAAVVFGFILVSSGILSILFVILVIVGITKLVISICDMGCPKVEYINKANNHKSNLPPRLAEKLSRRNAH